MDEENKADTTTAPAAETEATASALSQEANLTAELAKVEQKPKRTRLETLTYNKERIERELADERRKNGIEDDENRPLTLAEFKALRQQEAQDTALTLADQIESEAERKLTKYHLENTIKPSGDAATDLRNARLIVNSVKNSQIVEETLRATRPKAAGSAASAPPKETKNEELTKEETELMKGFHLTKEQVLAARPKQ